MDGHTRPEGAKGRADQMRVLMVTDGLWNGGAERQLALLASSLPDSYSVALLTLQEGPYRFVLEGLGIPVEVAPRRSRRDVGPALKMWSYARHFAPDVVHSWGWMSTAAMVPWCRMNGVPLLNGIIRGGSNLPGRERRARLSIALSDGVVANSHAGLRAFGVPEARARVVYNGFDEARLEGIAGVARRSELDGVTTVVMAGRMYPEKDWRALLRAAKRLRDAGPGGWRFVALGDGPERGALMTEARGLIADGVVEFPAPGIEALPLIASADIGLLLTSPGVGEGCSNAIMEYMACGLPVVCSDSGGNRELVTDGVIGSLVPPGDAAALVEALLAVQAQPAVAAAMGRAGRERIHSEFSVPRMVDGFDSAYRWVRGG